MSDVMLLGVLRTPIDFAMSTDAARTYYWFRGQEAADRIEALQNELRDTLCPSPVLTAPDDQTTGECVASGKCGCGRNRLLT
jgi:hypothetical protein